MLNNKFGRLFISIMVSLGLLIPSVSCGGKAAPAAGSTQPTAQTSVNAATSLPTSLTVSLPAPTLTSTATSEASINAAGERVYQVTLIANPGVLQSHGSKETEYRELTPGKISLASGTFLKTLEGEAFVIFPNTSVMRMDKHTELQVGMYDNGIMIWQHSGRTYHFVRPHKGTIYEVATPFGTAVAHGTTFEIRLNYPIDGWTVVYVGEIGVVATQNVIDPNTGQVIGTTDVYGFVPSTALLLGPEGSAESFIVVPGHDLEFVIDPATGRVTPREGTAISNDDFSIRNDQVADALQLLFQRCDEGSESLEDCGNWILDLINQATGHAENEGRISLDLTPTPVNLGKRWSGKIGDKEVVTFCYNGEFISMIGWVTDMHVLTLDTGEEWEKMAVFNMYNLVLPLDHYGYFRIFDPFMYDPAYPNFTILFTGTISSNGTGQVVLSGQGTTDVEHSFTGTKRATVYATSSDCIY